MNKTSSIEELKSNGFRNYTWGDITDHWEFGRYNIVRYKATDGDISYHGWVDKKDTHHGWSSFDRAILGVVALANDKHFTINTQADYHMATMLELPDVSPEDSIEYAHR